MTDYIKLPSSPASDQDLELAFSHPRALYAAIDTAYTAQPPTNRPLNLGCVAHDKEWQPTPVQFKNVWESYNDTASAASTAVAEGGGIGSGSGQAKRDGARVPELKVSLAIRSGREFSFELQDG